MPKFHLLYFKHLLDIAIINFFDTYNDCFKNIDGKYVLSLQNRYIHKYMGMKRIVLILAAVMMISSCACRNESQQASGDHRRAACVIISAAAAG